MPHKADKCFSCHLEYSLHGTSSCKCKQFEFIAASSRLDSDIIESFAYPSDSSARTYSVNKWRQGDWSCNCVGWRNYRKCKHIEMAQQGKKASSVNTTSNISGIVSDLNSIKAESAERLDDVASKIDFYQAAIEATKKALDQKKKDLIQQAVEEDRPKKEKAKEVVPAFASVDDPFGD